MKKRLAAMILALLMVLGAAPFAAAYVTEASDIRISDVVGTWELYSFYADAPLAYADEYGILNSLRIRSDGTVDYVENTIWDDAVTHKNMSFVRDENGRLMFQVLDDHGSPMTFRIIRLNGSVLEVSGDWHNSDGTPGGNYCYYHRYRDDVLFGDCGEDVYWELEGNTLTIFGEGAMADYPLDIDIPWYESRDRVNRIVIEDGVTYISWNVFYDSWRLKSVEIPASVTKIADGAFQECYELNEVQYGGTKDQWDAISIGMDNQLLKSASIIYADGPGWETPTVTIAPDGKTAKAAGDFETLYARVALILDNGGVSGLYITQAVINPDGTIVVPSFVVPGLTVKGVNVSLVPTLADIQSTTPNAIASGFKMY